MKRIQILIIVLFLSLSAYSQSIIGIITDAKEQPVSFANIRLEQADSVFVAGSVSDNDGRFSVSAPAEGDYWLIISCIGYQPNKILLKNLNKEINLGKITVEEASETLSEVTVTANRVVAKMDRQIILPSDMEIKSSNSGFTLLNVMPLPDIKINTIERTISTISGGNVEVRINDIKASVPQIQALRPSDVLRVEYIDNPGLRYADSGTEVVINFIVKQRETGFSGGVNLTNAFTTGFGNDNIYLKANYKRSEFGLNYYLSYRDYDERYADETQTFALPNNTNRYRNLKGVAVPFDYADHQLEFSYNLTQVDKYVFNVVLRNTISNSPHQDFSQIIHEEGEEDLQSYIKGVDKSQSPSLDIFYQIMLPGKQKLSANLVGTYISTDYQRRYNEFIPGNETPETAYGYSTDGKRYSVIGEAIYSKEFSKATLSAGLRGIQARTKNLYTGTVNESASMNNSNYYGYLQLQGKIKKMSYMVGAGLSRQHFSRAEKGFTYYTFRPSVMLTYNLFEGALLRYNFSISPSLPSLSSLSDIPQQLTDIEISRGNANLQPYRSYSNRLVFQWGNKFITTQLNGSYLYSKNHIMEEISRVDDEQGNYMFVYGLNNQKSFSRWNGQLFASANIVPDRLKIQAYGGINSYRSNGNQYLHKYTSWYGGTSILFSYKNFSTSGQIATRYNSLMGETIDFGENNCSIQCEYSLKNLNFSLGVLYPFSPKGWSAGEKKISDMVKKESWTYIGDNGNMIIVGISWDFNTGRKHKSGAKTLNNYDSDSGIAK